MSFSFFLCTYVNNKHEKLQNIKVRHFLSLINQSIIIAISITFMIQKNILLIVNLHPHLHAKFLKMLIKMDQMTVTVRQNMKFKLILLVNNEDSEEILIQKISFSKKKTTEDSVEILIQKIPFSKKNNCHKSVI